MERKMIYLDDAIRTVERFYKVSEDIRRKMAFELKQLPSTQEEQENGSWMCSDDMFETGICSRCGWDTAEAWSMCNMWYKYCPNCGDRKR